jgi:hypothetical protein
MSLLKEIKQRSLQDGDVDADTPEIVQDLYWTPSQQTFQACDTGCGHILKRLQRLEASPLWDWSKRLGRAIGPSQEAFSSHLNGAVLFGESIMLDLTKLRSTVASSTSLCANPRFCDNGLGSSLQSPSHSISADPESSGGEIRGANLPSSSQYSPADTSSTGQSRDLASTQTSLDSIPIVVSKSDECTTDRISEIAEQEASPRNAGEDQFRMHVQFEEPVNDGVALPVATTSSKTLGKRKALTSLLLPSRLVKKSKG